MDSRMEEHAARIERYKREIRGLLSDRRYNHSLAVAKQAVRLAERYGADRERAELAGILHDCCKEMKSDSLLHILRGSGIILDNDFLVSRGIWHAFAAAEWVQREYGIRDEAVISAIRWHTTGRAGMTLLDKVVYLADLTSEDRDYPDVNLARAIVLRDLDEAMRYALAFFIKEAAGNLEVIYPRTLAAYNDILHTLDTRAHAEPAEGERL